jgi:hypothetical protein
LKIEKVSDARTVTFRLVGRFQAEHVEELKKQMRMKEMQFVLDLKEVTLVDVDMVRFLGACESRGVKLVQCSQYIREWIGREQHTSASESE